VIPLLAENKILSKYGKLVEWLSGGLWGQFRNDLYTCLDSERHNINKAHKNESRNSNLFAFLTLLYSLTDAASNHQAPYHLVVTETRTRVDGTILKTSKSSNG
jgi:hypothetical protein